MKKIRRYKGREIHTGFCSICQKEVRAVGQRLCLKCHSEYMKEWRKEHKLTDAQKVKDNCRSYAHTYLKRGKIIKKPCIVCGSLEKLEMHHTDYTKPLEVIWYCRKHHVEEHIKIKELEKNNGKEKKENIRIYSTLT